MPSLRTSTGTVGASASVRELAKRVNIQPPISLRALIAAQPKPLDLDLRANPNNLQISPELVIIGHGFTPKEPFRLTLHNWPVARVGSNVNESHNAGVADVNGSFEKTSSHGFVQISSSADFPPDIEVTAVDVATGRSITASVSAAKFIISF